MEREQGDKVEYFLIELTAGNTAGNRGSGKNTGTEVVLVLPAVTVVSFLPYSFTHVLGLRSLHQKPRVGGTLGGSHRDGRSPVPWGDNTGGRDDPPPPQTIAFASHRKVPYIAMDLYSCTSSPVLQRSGTSVRSTSRRRGDPLASCCGSSKIKKRRCGVLAADSCGSGPLSLTDVAASL